MNYLKTEDLVAHICSNNEDRELTKIRSYAQPLCSCCSTMNIRSNISFGELIEMANWAIKNGYQIDEDRIAKW